MAGASAGSGRTPRGERRRQRLVEAAVEILEVEGFEAVTHRAVAARAGLPLAATTYYFDSRDELIEAAMTRFGGTYLERAREIVDRLPSGPLPPERAARIVVGLVAGADERTDPARLLTFYERYVQAGRHPRLRPIVRDWTAELATLVARVLDAAGLPADDDLPGLVVAMVDGLLLDALIDGDPGAPAVAAAGVARLLSRLLPER